MKTLKNLILVSILGLFISLPAMAQKGNYNRQPAQPCQGQRANPDELGIFNQIPNLTEDQKVKIKALHVEMLKKEQPIKNELKENEARLNTLVTAAEPDSKAINAQMDKIHKNRADLDKLHLQFHQDVRTHLTADQKVYFDKKFGSKGAPGCQGHGPKGCNGH